MVQTRPTKAIDIHPRLVKSPPPPADALRNGSQLRETQTQRVQQEPGEPACGSGKGLGDRCRERDKKDVSAQVWHYLVQGATPSN